ncbi:MAG: hypothetical protein P9L92_07260 [Candidatus Electryonea clarkiae]|nr:hypothetical protein [Candidatus Electryonea clarkiae]MDP8288362.1 hypothetical protein [Candidatus Electryonea clarkiae]
MKSTKIVLIISTLLSGFILFTGCISHKFFLDFSPGGVYRYVAEGDSLDLFDGRILFPPSNPWQETNRTREKDDEGNITWKYFFESKQEAEISQPIAPPEKNGLIQFQEKNYLVVKKKSFVAVFPGWDVTRIYGDQREFLPPEVDDIEKFESDTTLQTRLKQLEALGLQKTTARRYMLQVQNMILEWQRSGNVEDADSLMIQQGLKNFSVIIEVFMLTFKDKDPMEVSLEWYQELRDPMISICSEVSGGSPEWFANVADSIDFRWKTWKDMEDDGIELEVFLPSTWINANPDTVRNDTLFWSIESESLAEEDVVIQATGWTLVYWIDGLIALVIFGLIWLAFSKMQKKKE